MNQEQYIEERLDDQIEWYSKKSGYNQKWSKTLRIVEITCAAIIPFLSGISSSFPWVQFITGSLGVIIAVSAGFSIINKYQDNWIEYRTTSECLKHEKYLFLTQTHPYDEDDAFRQFVSRVESQISKQNSQWAMSIKDKQESLKSAE